MIRPHKPVSKAPEDARPGDSVARGWRAFVGSVRGRLATARKELARSSQERRQARPEAARAARLAERLVAVFWRREPGLWGRLLARLAGAWRRIRLPRAAREAYRAVDRTAVSHPALRRRLVDWYRRMQVEIANLNETSAWVRIGTGSAAGTAARLTALGQRAEIIRRATKPPDLGEPTRWHRRRLDRLGESLASLQHRLGEVRNSLGRMDQDDRTENPQAGETK